MIVYDGILKIASYQEDDSTTACLLDYPYLKKYYKMIAIDLSKQQALHTDPKAIQLINFIGNLDQAATMFFITEEENETILSFSQGTVRVL